LFFFFSNLKQQIIQRLLPALASATADSQHIVVQIQAAFALGKLVREACSAQIRILIDQV
jgi:hypothetical protein